MNKDNNIFKKIFGKDASISCGANARVNLIGEHTDYTGGYVLPCLLPYKTTVSIAKNKDRNFNVYSKYFDEKIVFKNLNKSKNNDWIDYITGCLFVFLKENNEFKNIYLDILINSNIPIGRGISSSSALCVATLKSLNNLFETNYNEKQIALLAQKVERNYIGVSGGLMDQMVSSIGIHGKGFFLNCKDLKYELLDIPQDWIFYLVDSEVQRNLRNSSYNERFKQLKEAEKILGVEYLGKVKRECLNKNDFNDEVIFKRAKHVINENERVIEAKKSILDNNINNFGNLMNLSHKSYSNDFEASTKDVDLLTKRSLECGALGSRLTGGGFGGFTVSLVEKKDYESWYKKMKKYYSVDKFFRV
tara:strand:- start:1581 stop:2663 length:1083 start_codon:yes stop_codon:yes gene_type:complete